MAKPRFFVRRIKLDQPFRRGTEGVNNRVGASFKAFAVIGASDSSFQLTLVPDAVDASIQGIPLWEGQWHNFEVLPNDAAFENPVAQTGAWVDVLISTEDPLTSGKPKSTSVSRTLDWSGSVAPQSKVVVTSTPAEILNSDGTRVFARLQYKDGAGKVYVGSQTELSDPDFKNICQDISPGEDFVWRGTGGLYARADGGDVTYSLIKGLNL